MRRKNNTLSLPASKKASSQPAGVLPYLLEMSSKSFVSNAAVVFSKHGPLTAVSSQPMLKTYHSGRQRCDEGRRTGSELQHSKKLLRTARVQTPKYCTIIYYRVHNSHDKVQHSTLSANSSDISCNNSVKTPYVEPAGSLYSWLRVASAVQNLIPVSDARMGRSGR